MSDVRCSNSQVFLCDGQELFCENSVNDIARELEETGKVKLDISDPASTKTVTSSDIVSYQCTD